MRKDRTLDPGLAYMRELGLRPERTRANCMRAVARASDEPTAFRIDMLVTSRGRSDGDTDDRTFYDVKNERPEAGMALTGAFDGDFIRKACNWLSANKECLHGDVLDVGCDCGLVSCFIARLAPGCRVVAIDQSGNAVGSGRALAERLGIPNIEFVHADLASFADACDAEGRRFGTVVSSRVSQENRDPRRQVDCRGKGFLEEAEEYAVAFGRYDALLDRVLADDGTLVCIERTGLFPCMLGMLADMRSRGLVLERKDEADLLRCLELDQAVDYSAFVFDRVPGAEETPADAVAFFHTVSRNLDVALANYEAYEAKLVEDIRRGPLIDGFTVSSADGSERWRIAYWRHISDPTNTLFYRDVNGCTDLYFLDVGKRDEVMEALDGFRARAADLGLETRPMDPETAGHASALGDIWEEIRKAVSAAMKESGEADDGEVGVTEDDDGCAVSDGTERVPTADVPLADDAASASPAAAGDRGSADDGREDDPGPSDREPHDEPDGSGPDFLMPMFIKH